MYVELTNEYSVKVIRGALDLYVAVMEFDPAGIFRDRSGRWYNNLADNDQDVLAIRGERPGDFSKCPALDRLAEMHEQYQTALTGLDSDDYGNYFDFMFAASNLQEKVAIGHVMVNDTELRVLSNACEVLARYHALQYDIVWGDFIHHYMWKIVPTVWGGRSFHDLIDIQFKELKSALGFGSDVTYGHGSHKMNNAAHVAWDAYEYFRHEIYRKNNPEGGGVTVDASPAYHWYKSVPLPVLHK